MQINPTYILTHVHRKGKTEEKCLMVSLFANAFRLQSFLNAKVFLSKLF